MSVITKLPLSRLETPRGSAKRVGDVGSDALRRLLRAGPVRFVIADVGSALRWVPEGACFDVLLRLPVRERPLGALVVGEEILLGGLVLPRVRVLRLAMG